MAAVFFVNEDHLQLGTWAPGAGVPAPGDTVVLDGVHHDIVARIFVSEPDGGQTIFVRVRARVEAATG